MSYFNVTLVFLEAILYTVGRCQFWQKYMKYNLKDTMKLHFMDDYYKPLENLFLKFIVLILSSAVRAATFVECPLVTKTSPKCFITVVLSSQVRTPMHKEPNKLTDLSVWKAKIGT